MLILEKSLTVNQTTKFALSSSTKNLCGQESIAGGGSGQLFCWFWDEATSEYLGIPQLEMFVLEVEIYWGQRDWSVISLSLLGGSQIQWESVAFTLLIVNNGAALEWLLGGAGRWEGGGVVRKWPEWSNALPSPKRRFRFLVIDIVWQQGQEGIWNPWPCVLFFQMVLVLPLRPSTTQCSGAAECHCPHTLQHCSARETRTVLIPFCRSGLRVNNA